MSLIAQTENYPDWTTNEDVIWIKGQICFQGLLVLQCPPDAATEDRWRPFRWNEALEKWEAETHLSKKAKSSQNISFIDLLRICISFFLLYRLPGPVSRSWER